MIEEKKKKKTKLSREDWEWKFRIHQMGQESKTGKQGGKKFITQA